MNVKALALGAILSFQTSYSGYDVLQASKQAGKHSLFLSLKYAATASFMQAVISFLQRSN